MIHIIDFDYTIIDTDKLIAEIAKIYGYSVERYLEIYNEVFESKSANYNNNALLDYLIKNQLISSEEKKVIVRKTEAFLSNIDKIVYEDIYELIDLVKKRGDKIVLLTFGDPEWQAQKVEGLSFKNYFDDVIITEDCKTIPLERFEKDEDVVIINDNAKECVEIQEKYNQYKIYLIESRHSDNIKHSFKKFSIRDIINELK